MRTGARDGADGVSECRREEVSRRVREAVTVSLDSAEGEWTAKEESEHTSLT